MLRSVLTLVAVALLTAAFAPELVGRFLQRPPVGVAVIETPDNDAARFGVTRIIADRRGHYVSEIEVNGRRVEALIDTGATMVALRYEDARAIGLVFPGDRFEVPIRTANGVGYAKPVRLRSLRLGEITINDVEALVVSEGALGTNLLGMSFLKRLSRYEVRGSMLVLER